MTTVLIVFGILVIISIIAIASKSSSETKAIEAAKDDIRFSSFRISDSVECTDSLAANKFLFAVDDSQRKIRYVSGNENYTFGYEDVLSAELLIDDSAIETKKSLTGTVGGSIVGGIIGGGVGAVIGGLSSKGTSVSKVKSIKVHTLLREGSTKSFDIVCLNMECKKGDATYNEAFARAQRVMDIYKIVIDKIDREKKPSVPQEESSSVDEISKLVELLDKGVITQEEFVKLKAKIIH